MGETTAILPRLQVENVSKVFRVARRKAVEEVSALRAITFSVEEGEVVGIVGPEGSGKSTLLRIIAGISNPSGGRVIGRGRVVPLLELGWAFHNDQTGWQNVISNGLFCNIPKEVVAARAASVFEFAGLQEFKDVPIKRYSAGMYLRFAFSVAVSMDPAILLADDVFGAGDLDFQENALRRIRAIADGGSSVLLVSRDPAVISRLCDRVLWMDDGEIIREGDPAGIMNEFLDETNLLAEKYKKTWSRGTDAGVNGRIESISLVDAEGQRLRSPRVDQEAYIRIDFVHYKNRMVLHMHCIVEFYTRGNLVIRSIQTEPFALNERRMFSVTVRIPPRMLTPSIYTSRIELYYEEGPKVLVSSDLSFVVRRSGSAEDEASFGPFHGLVAPELEWELKCENHVETSTP